MFSLIFVRRFLISLVYITLVVRCEEHNSSDGTNDKNVNLTSPNGTQTILNRVEATNVSSTISDENVNTSTLTPVILGSVQPTRHFGREGEIEIEKPFTVDDFTRTTVLVDQVSSTTIGPDLKSGSNATNGTKVDIVAQESEKVNNSSRKQLPVTKKPFVPEDHPTSTTHQRIVPKKGVNFTDTLNVTQSTIYTNDSVHTQSSVVPPINAKKPTITTSDDDDNSQPLDSQKGKLSNSIPSVPSLESYKQEKEDFNFVIVIVAVILSVPLVAIIINFLYKRGKEWWIHRHYSRMDFLIDGMYNS